MQNIPSNCITDHWLAQLVHVNYLIVLWIWFPRPVDIVHIFHEVPQGIHQLRVRGASQEL